MMLIPKRPLRDLTETEVEKAIENGRLDFGRLDDLIPRGVPNTWRAQPTDRIKIGFVYEWTNTDATKWHVHGHAPDPLAPASSNASNGWVVRIKHGNRWLLQETNTPPVGQPSHWSRNQALANQTHLPATSQTLTRGRRNSF